MRKKKCHCDPDWSIHARVLAGVAKSQFPRTAVVFTIGDRILMLLVSEHGPPHTPTQSLSPWDVRTRPVPQSETLCTAQRSGRPRRNLLGVLCTVLKRRLRQGISAKRIAAGAKLFKKWRFKQGRFDVREISWNTF